MSDSLNNCPPGPNSQSPLNLSSKDKFILVLNLPQVLRKQSAMDSSLDIEQLEMRVFGTVVPQISVPPVDTRILGQSVKFTSLSRPEYSPLTLSFVVDNDYSNYYLLWRWLTIYNDPVDSIYTGYNKSSMSVETEYQTTFSILGLNEYNNPTIEFQFRNAFITSLGPINYNYRDSEQIEATADFTFNQLVVTRKKN